MRLDKYLVECGVGSRSQVKKLILNGEININNSVCKDNSFNVKNGVDEVNYKEQKIIFKEFRYYVLFKLAGYITATEDKKDKTVMELLPSWVNQKDLFPIGRLDKDTEGLLLFSNDGKLAHELTSPKKHVDKIYRVSLRDDINQEALDQLEKGVDIGGYITKEAKAQFINNREILLTIKEGKFHQVKKMMHAVGNEVTYLKRETFGKLQLGNMTPGEVIEVEREDII